MAANDIIRIMFYDDNLKEWIVDTMEIAQEKQESIELMTKNEIEPASSLIHTMD